MRVPAARWLFLAALFLAVSVLVFGFEINVNWAYLTGNRPPVQETVIAQPVRPESVQQTVAAPQGQDVYIEYLPEEVQKAIASSKDSALGYCFVPSGSSCEGKLYSQDTFIQFKVPRAKAGCFAGPQEPDPPCMPCPCVVPDDALHLCHFVLGFAPPTPCVM